MAPQTQGNAELVSSNPDPMVAQLAAIVSSMESLQIDVAALKARDKEKTGGGFNRFGDEESSGSYNRHYMPCNKLDFPNFSDGDPQNHVNSPADFAEISLHALFGQFPTSTMKLQGTLGTTGVLVLVDSGSTHNFISDKLVQEMKLITHFVTPFGVQIGNVDGKYAFEFGSVDAEGRSGGILSVWDPSYFRKVGRIIHRRFLVTIGVIKPLGCELCFVNVHAPNDSMEKRSLWAELLGLRLSLSGLMEYQMGGGSFTYISDSGVKMSKLDRLLLCSEFHNRWPLASVTVLAKDGSDHRPLLLSTGLKGSFLPNVALLDLMVRRTWVLPLRLEGEAENRILSDYELGHRSECVAFVKEFENLKCADLRQMARVQWAVEGDENSKLFHCILNANLSSKRLHGLSINEVWEVNPILIKDVVFGFFEKRFREPETDRPVAVLDGIKRLKEGDVSILDAPFSVVEIKDAVRECDGERAPGPDGFNFKFLKTFWSCFEGDFIKIFDDFYANKPFSFGCLSSFITLIPKSKDPGGLNDYRPISLIGCMNKVISKVLVQG
ncbi:uncharacterized protein LOC143615917 [Bidens hawaiensis]|uniref:uncharacterized protein LOC143615917 n=1 Tax=Bidens hawaiensis TaxID=980011 RepID=UPI00404A0748